MRRKDREIADLNQIVEIVDKCDVIRIGLADGNFPYIVPLNFGYKYEEGELTFCIHGAMAGRKYEMLQKKPVCSFEMDIPIKMECLVKEKDVTMRYESVMGTATVEFVPDAQKKQVIDEMLMSRYDETKDFEYNEKALAVTAVMVLHVTDIIGKRNVAGAD